MLRVLHGERHIRRAFRLPPGRWTAVSASLPPPPV
jgi:hypothetical protein